VIPIKSFRDRSSSPDGSTAGKPLSLGSKVFLYTSLLVILSMSSVGVSHATEIESVIPAYSVAYMVVKDVPNLWDAVRASASWQTFLSSEELEREMQEIKTKMRRAEELLGVDLRALVEAFGHRIAFVQIYIDAEVLHLPVIIADVTDSEGATEIIWEIEQTLNRDEEYEVQSHAGAYLTVPFGLVRRRGEESTVRYAFLDNLLVFAPGQDTFEAVVDAHLGEEPSLIHDPKFNRTRAEVSSDSEVFAYVNLEILWPILWDVCDPEWSAVLQVLGAYEVRSIAWTANLLGSTRDQEMYIYTADGRGLLASAFAEPKPLFSPHLIPASDADMFFAVHLDDPAVLWEKTEEAIINVIGEEEYAGMQTDISRFERQTGLSLKDDILLSLTAEIGFAISVPEVMRPMEGPESLLEDGLMMFCGVKDCERCAMSIERILSAADVQIRQMEYKGVTVYQIPALSGPEVPVGYMFAGDFLIFGNFQKLENLINEEPPLVVSEKFAQINSQFPQQLGLLSYVDLGKVEELLLRTGKMAILQETNPENPPEDDTPRPQTLGSIGGTLICDGEGLKAKSVGTPEKNWLETVGRLATLLIRVPL
jgi:hypothetical protein